MSRALEVFRFELGYQIRRVSTRIYLAVFLGLSLMMTYAFLLDARNDGYFFNAPIITMAVSIIASMFSLLVIAGVAGDAATRDLETRLDSLLFTTPVGKAAYLGGRFLGAFAVTALLLLAVPIVLLLATKFPGLEPEILGPFRPAAYLASYFFFAVPNAFVGTAVVFAFAALTRRAIASYAGAALLFFSTFLSETVLADRMGHWWIGRMADPLGYTTLRAFWRTLNPLQKNTLLPGLDGALLTNRLVWMGIALSVLAFAWARFRFAIRSAATPLAVPAPDAERASTGVATIRETRRVFGARQLLAITIESFRDLVLSRGWLTAPLVAVLFVFTAPELLEVELGTPGAATTARVAALFGPSELAFLITLLIALSAGELVWRERDSRIDAIADVTPVPEWVAVTGKFLAIALMLAFTHAIFLLAGIGVQTALGYPQLIDVALYIKIILGFQLTGYLLVAALAMAIHVLVNQKYVGNVLVILAFLATQMAREVGVHHNLLLYGGAPEWTYSEMIGFGPEVTAWRWFTLYWTGWALLLGLAGYLFWIRGAERGLRTRIALARRRLTRWPAAIGATALMIIAGAGGFVFYNTNVLNHYYTDAELDARRVEYERRYGRYASLPQPLLAATKLHVDFYPQRNAASIRGSYRLENRGNAAIDAIHVVSHSGLETNGITFDRASRLTHDDRDFGYRIYALAHPLQPGESVRMNFDIAYERRGFTNDGANPAMLHNGSWIQHRAEHTHGQRQWLPVIGYQPNRAPDRDEPRLEDIAARHD
ncbi:MAG TPA: ABC transporter permease, partial [Thermoanaerobaculia bacterium]|nr:ABC transporter permease [Thermoanaerobaculia bacterium]